MPHSRVLKRVFVGRKKSPDASLVRREHPLVTSKCRLWFTLQLRFQLFLVKFSVRRRGDAVCDNSRLLLLFYIIVIPEFR